MDTAIRQAREYGLLGTDILGSGFDFDADIVRGAGAFVSGEETALIASIEGQRAFPRQRPPYPSRKGLFGKPTVINNVETWANVPSIIRRGAAWFAGLGTETSKGTKVFSLVGRIKNTGLVEVPMGTRLRDIVLGIGGGIPGGREFKAIQIGGPSGGCLPRELLDLPVDYESLKQAGTIMGSGGLIVMDESTCMVDMARYFTSFAQDESCGNCTPCRIGNRILLDTLEKIVAGEGQVEDLDTLQRAAKTMSQTALCGLGQAASNPVASSLRYFQAEYEAHINQKFCQSGVCDDLFEYYIDSTRCNGCGLCVETCPSGAIQGRKRALYHLDPALCGKCHACVKKCARNAIKTAPVGQGEAVKA
jgi:NADH:ubiquinone oxidoreductase subunit F (NADH-binding)/NAD-dependent dihydropyrimidine dehydrogenase PreA subunit